MNKTYTQQLRVYYEDTDAGGVMYHANYLNFFERTRTEWLRSKGIEQKKLSDEQNIIFAIRKIDINFIKPARLDDLLTVSCAPVHYKNASMLIMQHMMLDQTILATAEVKVVTLQADNFKPRRFPQQLKQEIML